MSMVLRAFLDRVVRFGTLTVHTVGGSFEVGNGSAKRICIRLHDRRAALQLMTDPSSALGDLYMDGRLTVEEGSIYDLLALAWLNLGLAEPPGPAKAWAALRHATRRLSQLNGLRRAEKNVAHHYDLDRRLYSLFLDADWQYSCAYFEYPDQSLEAAQQAKKRHIAAKLWLKPGSSVLDIGSGWGGLALYLEHFCEARITGVTLSQEQLKVAGERAGASKNVSFHLQDYRDVTGRFDRIVSVGMFEHVGLPYYDTFFQTAAERLDHDGVMLLHTIGRIDRPGPTNPWMARYIFPGGYVPALSDILPAIERSGLIVTDIEILRIHYAETLKAWRERFLEKREVARNLYDERFCRMWEFYLACCESAFRFGNLVVFQVQLAKHLTALPITRDYIAETEAVLEQKERTRQSRYSCELPLDAAATARRAC
ncbi:MAG: cyclopropane-fatty-acyl-phospholipid synthase family protein [Hyphomicrobium sp.]|nr:cyclopropane-fatty-acyl-phospholipid synthase family protein [Hyphomicrobium sp.]